MTTGTTEYPATTEREVSPAHTPRPAAEDARRRARFAIPRSRGMVSGVLLVILGAWGAVIPFVGPYFGYEFGSDQAWAMSWTRLWLNVLPGVAMFLGGLLLIGARRRAIAVVGGWLGVAGGAWFIVGPTVAMLWGGSMPGAPIGAPIGSEGLRVVELLGYFYALGAAGLTLSALALGRLSMIDVRDVDAAAALGPAGDGARHTPHPGVDTATPAAAPPGDGETPGGEGAPRSTRRRRWFRRS
jgi:hypothetical protein